MRLSSYSQFLCISAFGIALLYLTVTNRFVDIDPLRRTSSRRFYARRSSFLNKIQLSDCATQSEKESASLFKPWESRLFQYYPRLPILIYNQNLKRSFNCSKTILIGTGFFGTPDWGATKGNSSREHSKWCKTLIACIHSFSIVNSLNCPFLSDHCDITTDWNRFSKADAIVYHMADKFDQDVANRDRSSHQRFVFTLWEPPIHTPNLTSYDRFFNWTMTYRFDSHVLATYYFVKPYIHKSSNYLRLLMRENWIYKLNLTLKKYEHRSSIAALVKKKLGIAAALITNCKGTSKRLEFIDELKRYIEVHVYGRCGLACPNDTDCRAFIAENYFFILSFENSVCSDYTSKLIFIIVAH